MELTDRPAWVADAVFYQIFPDRFAQSAALDKPAHLEPWDAPPTRRGYKGGDLLGVVEHLDWLTDLGVNAIYLNPIFRSASNHRYHTHDYLEIDPLLGGDPAFEALLDECHRRSIRVVLDGVFNHTGRGFFQFNDILENAAASPWLDWFTIHAFPLDAYGDAANYAAWWDDPALPKLNTELPAVREYLMSIAEHWVRRGIDGWRLDVPEEIHTPGFWEEMRTRVRAINPDAYLVGEIWGPAADWISNGVRFDGVMNYPMTEANLRFAAAGRVDGPIVEPVNLTLQPPLDAMGYAAAVEEHLDLYGWEAHAANLNLLGSHDTARVLSMVGGDSDSVALAASLMFTFPGAPCVYYGDEIGMPGGHDPGCRAGFPWDRPEEWDRGLLAAFRGLAALRHAQPALRSSSYGTLAAERGLYVFSRGAQRERLVVAVNTGDSADGADIGIETGGLLWGEGTNSGTTVTVPARRAAVWSS